MILLLSVPYSRWGLPWCSICLGIGLHPTPLFINVLAVICLLPSLIFVNTNSYFGCSLIWIETHMHNHIFFRVFIYQRVAQGLEDVEKISHWTIQIYSEGFLARTFKTLSMATTVRGVKSFATKLITWNYWVWKHKKKVRIYDCKAIRQVTTVCIQSEALPHDFEMPVFELQPVSCPPRNFHLCCNIVIKCFVWIPFIMSNVGVPSKELSRKPDNNMDLHKQ